MREIFKSGSVGGAPGNRCFYLEADLVLRRLNPSVLGRVAPGEHALGEPKADR
jgi:hypothetical protein